MLPEQSGLSVKALLKEVYVAHASQVKSLEKEIEDLKNKLIDSERKLKESNSECKRCLELEEAFNSCKAALHEQTKWFENLGQKFSVFNTSDSRVLSNKPTEQSNINLQDDKTPGFKITTEKSAVAKQNFLKNLMSLNSECLDSLDLCSAPLCEKNVSDFSTLNPDCLVLAPDTVDVIENETREKRIIQTGASKQKQTNQEPSIDNLSEGTRKKRFRTDSESSGNGQRKKSLPEITPKDQECQIYDTKPHETELVPSNKNITKTTLMKDEILNSTSKATANALNSKCKKPDANISVQEISIKKKNITSQLDITISKTGKKASSTEKLSAKADKSPANLGVLKNDSINNVSYHVSPSLLPTTKKVDINAAPTPTFLIEDVDDFQTPSISKVPVEDNGTWTACDKKKLKKAPSTKFIKSTSKYKMSLSALPANYKKPTYRQTKLSKSIFQPKASKSSNLESQTNPTEANQSDSDDSVVEDNRVSSPDQRHNINSVMDIDATCIPDNFQCDVTSSNAKEIGSGQNRMKTVQNISSENSEDSSDTTMESIPLVDNRKLKNGDKKDFEDFLSSNRAARNENIISSFDRLPKKKEPNFKYKEETVRKKAERKQMNAFDCRDCEKYYNDLGLTDAEKRERMKKCSRHRANNANPPTPEHFWELEFPDTQECKARGYLDETQKANLKSHRRRPLKLP